MPRAMPIPAAFRTASCVVPLLGLLAALVATPLPTSRAAAATLETLPVGDPLEDELRWLEVLGPGTERIRLPRLGTRPLQALEIAGRRDSAALDLARRIGVERLERWLVRDLRPAGEPGSVRGAWPRLWSRAEGDDQRAELSVGFEGRGEVVGDQSRFENASGVHGRIGLQTGAWFAFAHVFAGHEDDAKRFADPIVSGGDEIVFTEQSTLGYTDPSGRWAARFGRDRWHWGPGDEASLVLSKTSAPLTALAFNARLEPLRADVVALSATLDAAAGEQLAAHRLEWRPADGLRVGVTEAARYRAQSWQALYTVGVIPYVLVQRIQVQEEPDSVSALRNNVLVAADVAWRLAPGSRLYGELAVDDFHSRTNDNPDKYAYQLGWEGAAAFRGTRLTWGTEYTRLTRYMYTSFFGRDYESQGRPLGFPIGPDSRRLRIRGDWDLSTDWQLRAAVARTDKGENDLDEPFVPGSPRVSAGTFEGVVEKSREAEAGVRWWPASGADVTVLAGYRWVDDAGHQPGERLRDWTAALVVRLIR
jgi:hypothetical protein